MTNPNPDLDDTKIAKQLAQSLIQYAPLGGNLFIFGSFAWSKSLLEAGIAALLFIPTTIWARFSEGFIEEFGRASNNWGKNTGKALTQALELSVLQRLARLEDKYIRAQGMKCEDLEVDGFQFSDLDCVPLLEKVFVPLKLHRNSFVNNLGEERLNIPGYGRKPEDFKLDDIYTIWEFLQEYEPEKADRLVIKAYGGYGKTTLLRHVAYAFMSGEYKKQEGYLVPKRLPVLIYLRNAQTILWNVETLDLPAFIHSYHLSSLSKRQDLQAQFSIEWIDLQLQRGTMLLMFDGFDEVRKEQRKNVSRWIGEQMQEYPASMFIVTSRPKAYDQDFVAKQRCNLTVAVDKFSSEQQQTFIERWYRSQEIKVRRGRKTDNVLDLAQRNADNLWEQLETRPELKALAENPLMLNIMVTVHRSKKGQQLPDRKAELYQQIFNLQLGTRISERSLPLMLSAMDSQRILQRVAFMMLSAGIGTQVEQQVLLALLGDSLPLAEELDEPKFFALEDWLFQLEHRSELLVKRDALYEFAHKSFQEFLAAKYVKSHKKEASLIDAWKQDAEWEGTVLMYATLVNPTKLIETLFDSGEKDEIVLASKCLDITPRKVSKEVKEKLERLDGVKIDKRYKKLTFFLRNQDFKAADYETYRVMCEILDIEAGNSLFVGDFINIAPSDLRVIDKLWSQYSKGQFGLSAQQKIWDICGIKMNQDRENWNRENWKKIGEIVQWRKNDNWIPYDEMNFTIDSPYGYLPRFCFESMFLF